MGGIGGGTFDNYDKIVPGIYFKEEQITEVSIDSNGIVAYLLPVNQNEPFNAILVNTSNYEGILMNIDDSVIGHEIAIASVKEMLYNARYVYIIPLLVDDDDNCTEEVDDIEYKLTRRSFDVLFYLTTGEDDEIVFSGIENVLLTTNNRFFIVYCNTDENFWDNIKQKPNIAKWFIRVFQEPNEEGDYDSTGECFVSGAYSILQLGNGLSGFKYNGESDIINRYVPRTSGDVEKAITNGKITFYNNGNQYFILKDITFAYSIENAPSGYKRGEYVRLEKYFYNYLTNIYSTIIQGKPNSMEQRSIIHSVILEELYRLQSLQVIENVSSKNVSVTKPTEDSILITLSYKPIASIEIIYIKYQVEV